MFLKIINLQNFRNYQKETFEFEGQTTLVVGPNTSGKTNLLEAIYLLATGRSFRAEVETEMIGYGEEVGRIGAEVACRLGESSDASVPAAGASGYASPAVRSNKDITSRQRSPRQEELVKFEILLTTGSVSGRNAARKKYLVNGVSRRMVDFVGQLKAVYFGPEDLQLVTDSPSLRRRYLDMVLSQVDREYRRASLSYEKGLRQRNKVLEEIREKWGYQGNPPSTRLRRTGQGDRREDLRRRLYFWDQLLVKNGNYITGKREEFVDFVSARRGKPRQGKTLRVEDSKPEGLGNWRGWGIGEQAGSQFQLEYVKSVISPAALEENFEREIRAGMTLYGPHRDDIKFKVQSSKFKVEEGRDLSIYGSRGEQRLAVLWLKMGELEYIDHKTGERPVLLLDDIFSELDRDNIRLIGQIGLIGRQQTIITTTDERMIKKSEREKMQVVRLR